MQGFRSPTGRDRCKSEFGTGVAAEEEDLPDAIARLLAAPKPDAVALSLCRRTSAPASALHYCSASGYGALPRLLEPQSTLELIRVSRESRRCAA
jgi:hypothetical protein